MTQEEILEYNKLCAEFLNLHRDEEVAIYKFTAYPYDFLKFHSDWNWIHEVVEAICKLGFRKYSYSHEEHSRCVFTDLSIIFQNHSFGGGNIVSDSGKIVSEKEAVVQAINQFLIWYNENN